MLTFLYNLYMYILIKILIDSAVFITETLSRLVLSIG